MSNEPFGLQLAKGKVYESKTVNKFGFNSAVGTDSETIWEQGGEYSYPASASTMTLSSANTNDAAAGTGARTITIFGLDADYNEVSETLTLNGQTAVNTSNSYLRINRGIVRSAGSGGENAGIIYVGTGTVTAGVPANKYLTLGAGNNQTLMCLWTVPADYTAYLLGFMSTTGNDSATPSFLNVELVARPLGEVFQVKERYSLATGDHKQDFNVPLRFEEKTDLEVRAWSSSGSVTWDVSGQMEIVYVKN